MARPSRTEAAAARQALAVTAEQYNQFVAGLDLEGIRLVHAEISAPRLPEAPTLQPHLAMEDASFENREGGVRVLQTLCFSGDYGNQADPVVRVKAQFEVTYSTETPMDADIFMEFGARNLPLNTWPYFRELVHTALARVGWPVLVLPVYKSTHPLFQSAQRIRQEKLEL